MAPNDWGCGLLADGQYDQNRNKPLVDPMLKVTILVIGRRTVTKIPIDVSLRG